MCNLCTGNPFYGGYYKARLVLPVQMWYRLLISTSFVHLLIMVNVLCIVVSYQLSMLF